MGRWMDGWMAMRMGMGIGMGMICTEILYPFIFFFFLLGGSDLRIIPDVNS